MKRVGARKALSVLVMVVFLLQMSFVLPPPAASAREIKTDFFSSFEEDDLTWEDTVETDSKGNKRAKGVDGHIVPEDRIPGDITEKVKEIKASANNPPHETDQQLIDGDVTTKWLAFEPTAWIELRLSEPEAVVKYALTSANDYPERDPRDWTLSGSEDGENWTVLDRREGERFDERFQTKVYEFENNNKYSYYRLEITRNAGANITQLAELQLSNGIEVPPPPPSDMKSHIASGPSKAYTAKRNAGWTGLRALTYYGTHTAEGRAYSYNKIYEVDILVTPDTRLSYYIFPEFTDKDHLEYASTYASVDLAFSDGTYLSELGAVDQHGVKLNPRDQGESKTLYPHQWNFKKAHIGKVAAGKRIKRILVAYDNPKGPAVFQGHIDDIRIEGKPKKQTYSRPSDYVNTLRGTHSNGTFSRGNTFPAVAVPHGFNFWTPVTDAGSTSWLYRYHEQNNEDNLPEIQAFSLSHEPSPWMGDRQTFQVMPSDSAEGVPKADRSDRALPFKRENEIAKAHYYSVIFENGIRTEIAPTDHAALFRFTFKGDRSTLIFDNVNNNGGIRLDPEKRVITGYSDVKSGLSTGATRMFFYAEFDKPVLESGRISGHGRDDVMAYYRFDTGQGDRTVTMRIATSLISVAQAKKNLKQEISPADTLETVRERAQKLWDDKLKIIEVEGASEEDLVTLYSNLYRLFLYPNSAYENVGTADKPVYKYASPFSPLVGENTPTKTGAKIVEGKVYVNNGFWDTYRTAWPAYVLLTPTKAGEMIDGFVQHYRDGGWIARWSSPGYADLMVGTSSDIAFADAYIKGVTNFDVKSFYQSAVKNAAAVSSDPGTGRKGLVTSIFKGYTDTSTPEGMSWAMDGYINDFGIANLAKALYERGGDDPDRSRYKEDYLYFLNRAQNYVHMFNPDVKFFMGRTPSGAWRVSPENFDPREWGGDYTETNAWNMAFHAPQDGQGLANLYGGRKALAAKLDEFFRTPETALPKFKGHYGGVIHEMREARDVRMGMYAHSNQPSHHILYMYNYAGQPWKTQEKVREVLSRLYTGGEIGQGYPGDEDNGEMSAWYIFSAAGFYPLRLGTPEYVIGAPYFKKMTIHLENGNKIVINAPKVSDRNKYIQRVKLNGVEYNKTTLSHFDLIRGATLDFEMGPKPSKWGTGEEALPPSITDPATDGSSLLPRPMRDLTDRSEGGGDARELFDNSSDTRVTFDTASPRLNWRFAEGPEKVRMYTLTSGDGSPAEDPKSWVLKGSRDGRNWTVLDERSGESFKWRRQTRAFEVKHPGKYSYYMLEINENNGAGSTTLAEVELLGYDDVNRFFGAVDQLIRDYKQSGELKEPLVKQLSRSLEQAGRQEQKGRTEQAVKHMEDFLKHLNNQGMKGRATDRARKKLAAEAHALIIALRR
ncbi:MAG: alpha-mannosidase [Thermoactinomycetaceae bacterium]|jgi:predicted alpha-1,2-mannosidase|nr:alpha-mannosidase [Thermoactinomycetaceae bacterium]